MEPQWHDLIFLVLPGIISIIVKPHWSGPAKFVVALGVCFAAAMAELILTRTCTLSNFPELLGKGVVLTMASYATIWKAWKVGDKLEEKVNG
ncbi:MAG TPA: hypothetical protein DCY27_01850 [Desulfobacterales bacterium]|jgi:hypothetical protein|nr:hypothetical protein [Desulfobacterales bacterium]